MIIASEEDARFCEESNLELKNEQPENYKSKRKEEELKMIFETVIACVMLTRFMRMTGACIT